MAVQVRREGGDLLIRPGGLRGSVRVPLAQITRWDCLHETLGRRFLAFHLGDRTAYAQLPQLSRAQRDALVASLTELVGQAPDVSLLEGERDNTHWLKVWEVIKMIGRYLRLFINPLRSPAPPPVKRPPSSEKPPSAA